MRTPFGVMLLTMTPTQRWQATALINCLNLIDLTTFPKAQTKVDHDLFLKEIESTRINISPIFSTLDKVLTKTSIPLIMNHNPNVMMTPIRRLYLKMKKPFLFPSSMPSAVSLAIAGKTGINNISRQSNTT